MLPKHFNNLKKFIRHPKLLKQRYATKEAEHPLQKNTSHT